MSIIPPDRKTSAFDNRVDAATIAKNRPVPRLIEFWSIRTK
jgi:hypothetical protein